MNGDNSVLDREYIPNELPHRDGHVQELRRSLSRIPDPEGHETIAIFGPTGSGKTTVARFVAQRYDAEYPGLKIGYVDCVSSGTQRNVLHELLAQTGHLPTGTSGPTQGYDYIARIRDTSDPLLLIIDELDFLDDTSLIHSLYGTYGLWTIFIGIDEYDIIEGLHSGTRSRLQGAHHIRLAKYTNQELTDILRDRIDFGLRKGIVNQSLVREIADRARGDAHLAISLLRECVNQFNPLEPEIITIETLDKVEDSVTLDVRQRYEEQLATHPRALFAVIKEADSISGSDLKQKYEEQVVEPRSDRMRQKYLERLERYNLIEKTGTTRNMRYHYNDI